MTHLERVITALGIHGVGRNTAHLLVEYFPSMGSLAAATVEDLLLIKGVGSHTAGNIVTWFNQPRNQVVLQKLREAGVFY